MRTLTRSECSLETNDCTYISFLVRTIFTNFERIRSNNSSTSNDNREKNKEKEKERKKETPSNRNVGLTNKIQLELSIFFKINKNFIKIERSISNDRG